MIKLHDRVKELSYVIGTGNAILSGAVGGFTTFSSCYSNNDSFFYVINDGTNYELGSGVYLSATNAIQRFPVKSTNSNNIVNFSEGTKEIYVNYPATNAVFNTSGLSPVPQNSGIAFWTSSNSLSYSNKFIVDSGRGNIGINKSNPYYAIDIGGLSANSIIRSSGFFVGDSGIYFPSGNDGTSSYSGGIQFVHFEPNQLSFPLISILQLSGIVNQNILLKKQNTGMVFAGPSGLCNPSCDPDYPTFRYLIKEDLPDLSSLYFTTINGETVSGVATQISGVLNNKIDTVSGALNDQIAVVYNNISSINLSTNVCYGRLSISPTNSVAEGYSDTIYFVPHNGNIISLYNGSSWQQVSFNSMVAKTVSTLYAPGSPVNPANIIFDIFAYLDNNAISFESVAWSNQTQRATQLGIKDGVYVKSGDNTRRYIGSVMPITYPGYPPTGGNKFHNINNYRYIYNHYNKTQVLAYSTLRTLSRTWTCPSNVWREIPNTYIAFLNSMTINLLCGIQEDTISVNGSVYYISSLTPNSNYMLTVNNSRINLTEIDNPYSSFSEPTSYSIGILSTDSNDNINSQIRGSLSHHVPIGLNTYYMAEKILTGKNSPNLVLDYSNGISTSWRC
jgi:hypothetical protein